MTTSQAPLGSEFGHDTPAAEVVAGIDLSGKTVFITGGYSGIGTETVKALHGAGARVILAGRRPEAAREALGDVFDAVTVIGLDLIDPASVDSCAKAVARETAKIDMFIGNAAIMACPLARDARGYESQFATNHLGHFQLAAGLWPLIAAAGAGARVVALSSLAHKRSAFHPDDPHYVNRPYEKWAAYGQAKTANALFAVGLDARAKAHGIRAFSVHPGGIMTNLGRYLTEEDREGFKVQASSGKLRWKTAESGAATSVWAATSPLLNGHGGVYCENCDVAALTDEDRDASTTGVMSHAVDPAMAETLWSLSEEMTGVRFAV
jgi:NAD(P)-dependent dehydrogenase (short-subunit alcohol dehydrogenase family)